MERSGLGYYAGGALLLALSLAVRIAAYPIVIADYSGFLSHWFLVLQTHPGLSAFKTPFSDYAPLYLYLLKILTVIPVSSLYSIKTLSEIFDLLTAGGTVLILRTVTSYTRAQRFFAFSLMLCIPTVWINSAVWGQSDAVYAAPLIFSLWFMLRGSPLGAAVAFGIAVAFKAQAVFFFPVLAGYLLRERRTIPHLAIVPLVYTTSILPAWLAGGSLGRLFTVYLQQAHEYTSLNYNSPSIFAYTKGLVLSSSAQTELFWLGIAASGIVAVIIAVFVARIHPARSPIAFIFLAFICVILVPYFLPRMHQRYFYPADVFSVVYALCRPKQWPVAVSICAVSYMCYMPFLSGQTAWFSAFQGLDIRIPAVLFTLIIVALLATTRGRVRVSA